MSVFSKVLRAGEGKKVRALRDLVPDVNAMEPEMEGLSDEALAHKTVEWAARGRPGAHELELTVRPTGVTAEPASGGYVMRRPSVTIQAGWPG